MGYVGGTINGNVVVRVERTDTGATAEDEVLVTADGRRWTRCTRIPPRSSWGTTEQYGTLRGGRVDTIWS